jgi:hypothetical protein
MFYLQFYCKMRLDESWNISDSSSGSARFDSRPRYQLSRLKFCIFLPTSDDTAFTVMRFTSQFTIHCHSSPDSLQSGLVTSSLNKLLHPTQTPWPESASELYRPSRLSAKLMPTFADRGVSRSQRGGSPTVVI